MCSGPAGRFHFLFPEVGHRKLSHEWGADLDFVSPEGRGKVGSKMSQNYRGSNSAQ